jgi:ethanolamine utilization protein EutJ
VREGAPLKVGVDLGTASIVVVVLDEHDRPLTWEMEEASVIRDGLVVDFAGASAIVRRLKERVEGNLGVELRSAAIAVPPGTGVRDCATHGYVVESVGLEVTSVLDEPTAVNAVLGIRDGAIVDIGGGTTGISILSEGMVAAVFDEPTGGTHVSLVIAGNRKIAFEEAERLKQDPRRHRELLPLVTPVLQKMASIVRKCVKEHDVKVLYLVGGTCCLQGMERVIEKETGIPAFKPTHPFLVTPLGIAMNCPVHE